jgi:hypothetical protein
VLWVKFEEKLFHNCLKMFSLRWWSYVCDWGDRQFFAKIKRIVEAQRMISLYCSFKGVASLCSANNFPFMYSQKRFSHVSLLISTIYFQNGIIMLGLEFQMVPWICYFLFLKVHKHEIFFFTFFAETEPLWSQGPVTRDFWKSYSIRPRYSTFKHLNMRWNRFPVCSPCDEISSLYAQCAIKFVPSMLSMDCTCKYVHILPLAEHARKFVPSMLSMRWNRFRVCSVCDKIISAYAQHTHAIIFENDSKIPN